MLHTRLGSSSTIDRLIGHYPRLPRSFGNVGHVVAIGRGDADSDTQVRNRGMGIVTAMELADRFGVHVASFGLHQNPFLKLGLEDALQRDEEGRAVVAMPVGVSSRRDFGVVDLNLRLRILRQRRIELIEQHVSKQLLAGLGVATEPESKWFD